MWGYVGEKCKSVEQKLLNKFRQNLLDIVKKKNILDTYTILPEKVLFSMKEHLVIYLEFLLPTNKQLFYTKLNLRHLMKD